MQRCAVSRLRDWPCLLCSLIYFHFSNASPTIIHNGWSFWRPVVIRITIHRRRTAQAAVCMASSRDSSCLLKINRPLTLHDLICLPQPCWRPRDGCQGTCQQGRELAVLPRGRARNQGAASPSACVQPVVHCLGICSPHLGQADAINEMT